MTWPVQEVLHLPECTCFSGGGSARDIEGSTVHRRERYCTVLTNHMSSSARLLRLRKEAQRARVRTTPAAREKGAAY